MIRPISFGNNSKLSIFHINDLHGQTDNISSVYYASRRFDREDNQNVDRIKLSGGDNICGDDPKKNSIISKMLNALNITASSVGNHEFDGGSNAFAKLIETTKAQFLSSNLNIPENNALKDKIQKSTIREINGTKYGIIGLTTFDLATSIKTPEFLDGIKVQNMEETIKTVQSEIDKLKEQGVDRIILLPHAGYEADKEIAKKTNGIDIIVSGHSHDIIEGISSGENYVFSKSNEPVLIVQAGDNGRYYGVCDIEFDKNGIITKANNNIYKTENKKHPILTHIIDSILGISPTVAFISKTVENPRNRRIEPNGWANMVVDSMKHEFKVDISVINAANIRKVPPLGKLTERMITETTPYNNKLIKTTITEKELVDAIKFACHSLTSPSGNPGLLIPSGFKYETSKNGELLRMSMLKDGEEVDIDINNPSDKIYTIALDEFLFKNNEYKPLNLKRDYEEFNFDKDKTAANYIKNLTQDGSPLEITDDGRVKIV